MVRVFAAVLTIAIGAGCGPQLDVGSDVLWTALHEGGNFDEWSSNSGGGASAFPDTNTIEVSSERPHHGRFAAKLSIDTSAADMQQNAGLSRNDALPVEAYYSAWYYLPRSVAVGTFWVIFKFQMQDASTGNQLYDLDLVNLPSGEMSLALYDHRRGDDVPLDVQDPVVPVGHWFQVEAFYRNAQDDTGRVTYWLDGRQIVDIAGQRMAPTPWIEWNACSVGENLTPGAVVLFIDDCAISRTRVGPAGIISKAP
jgi:hypothetical protein